MGCFGWLDTAVVTLISLMSTYAGATPIKKLNDRIKGVTVRIDSMSKANQALGFQNWARCSISGILHDFDVYQRKIRERHQFGLGVGGYFVVQLCGTLEKQKWYKIVADNLFTSIDMMIKIIGDGFHYTGTL